MFLKSTGCSGVRINTRSKGCGERASSAPQSDRRMHFESGALLVPGDETDAAPIENRTESIMIQTARNA